jgi:hypothetical protein
MKDRRVKLVFSEERERELMGGHKERVNETEYG